MSWHLALVPLATTASTHVASMVGCSQAALRAARQQISTSMMTFEACRGYGWNLARDLDVGGVQRRMILLC